MNNTKRVLRILFISLKLGITYFVLFTFLAALHNEARFDNIVILPSFIALLVSGSLVFHMKFLKIKKNISDSFFSRKISALLWIFNILSNLSFICFGFILFYLLITDPPNEYLLGLHLLINSIYILGIIGMIDCLFIVKFLKNNKPKYKNEIDEIGKSI